MDQPLRLIVNPASGRGRSGKRLPSVVEELHKADFEFRTFFTRSLEHAGQLASEALDSGEVPVAMGGDGLITSVVNSVVEVQGDVPLGIIPAGTGNDFARWLGIKSVNDAVAALVRGASRQVDLGKIGDRYFTCIASIGIDSNVVEGAARSGAIPAHLVYPVATARALRRWKPAHFTVSIDGESSDFTGFNVAVANGGSYGGGMLLAPKASLEDGLFDVVTIGDIGKMQFLMLAPRVFWGRHTSIPVVDVRRGKSVTISADRPFTVFADGEAVGQAPVTLTVAPQALKIFA